MKTTQYITKSATETKELGQQLGARLKGGETIELQSDLGGGKTTFVRGIATGAGSKDRVASPTFTISKEYNVEPSSSDQTVKIVHIDLYRLTDPGIIEHELADAIDNPQVITIVEWADIAQSVLPEQRVRITFTPIDETSRSIEISCPDKLEYLNPESVPA